MKIRSLIAIGAALCPNRYLNSAGFLLAIMFLRERSPGGTALGLSHPLIDLDDWQQYCKHAHHVLADGPSGVRAAKALLRRGRYET